MQITKVVLKNWRNFGSVDINLSNRAFVVGANASGKSNFLDVFRFLRDIASSNGGGLQKALKDRGGISKVRSLAARKNPDITVDITLEDNIDNNAISWRYELVITQETYGRRRPIIKREAVYKNNSTRALIERPNLDDEKDPDRQTQTYLEQINSNEKFRVIANFFSNIIYLHLVPQLLRYAEGIQGKFLENDPFGQSFLERIAGTSDHKRKRRLKRIQEVLQKAVPQLEELQFERDEINGKPHLKAKYSHWRVNGAWQREDQFSDGTLRLIGLFWVLQEEPGLLLLEEPELSLNSKIVSYIAPFIHKLQGKGQVIVTTHSYELLSDEGIDLDEVILLDPSSDATVMRSAKDINEVKLLVEGGAAIGNAILPLAGPKNIDSLSIV